MTSYSELISVFGRIGMTSFGGPAAQIALMHRALVDERSWLSEAQFLRALSFCMLLPGPEAMQLATYAGWRLRGIWGGVIAGGLFVLPGAFVIGVLAVVYASYGTQPQVAAVLLGIQATVIVIVARALWSLSHKTLGGQDAWALAILSFLAIFVFKVPFPLIIAAAALWGYLRANDIDASPPPARATPTPPQALALWAVLWLIPLPLLWLMGQTLLFDLAAFFAQLAVVTFGGAYAVLAYMAQEVVQIRGWLETEQMVDALGLAETTPGPLILVTQFVGMIAGHSAGGLGIAVLAGILTLWMTFIPCFLWIFAGAPYVENLLARPRLKAALSAITAAVVGVILNLSLWFMFHVLFNEIRSVSLGFVSLDLPNLLSLNGGAVALCAFAAVLLFAANFSVPLVIVASAGAGMLLQHVITLY